MIETSHVTKNPQRECITLDRTREQVAVKIDVQLFEAGRRLGRL